MWILTHNPCSSRSESNLFMQMFLQRSVDETRERRGNDLTQTGTATRNMQSCEDFHMSHTLGCPCLATDRLSSYLQSSGFGSRFLLETDEMWCLCGQDVWIYGDRWIRNVCSQLLWTTWCRFILPKEQSYKVNHLDTRFKCTNSQVRKQKKQAAVRCIHWSC